MKIISAVFAGSVIREGFASARRPLSYAAGLLTCYLLSRLSGEPRIANWLGFYLDTSPFGNLNFAHKSDQSSILGGYLSFIVEKKYKK
jgi:hypothetical protein